MPDIQMENKNKEPKKTFPTFIFNRIEFSGSLGDLGALLPIAIGMIVLNGLNATNVMVTVGLFYIIAGLYFKVPVPVQPMKVIGAYAIAVGLTPIQIISASLWMGLCTLFLGTTGLIHIIAYWDLFLARAPFSYSTFFPYPYWAFFWSLREPNWLS